MRGAQLLRGEARGRVAETGGVLGFDDAGEADGLRDRAARFGVPAERIAGARLARRWPAFAGARVAAALHVPSDGVIDVVRLLAHMAESGPARRVRRCGRARPRARPRR